MLINFRIDAKNFKTLLSTQQITTFNQNYSLRAFQNSTGILLTFDNEDNEEDMSCISFFLLVNVRFLFSPLDIVSVDEVLDDCRINSRLRCSTLTSPSEDSKSKSCDKDEVRSGLTSCIYKTKSQITR